MPFFEALRAQLAGAGIDLDVVHGQADADLAARADEGFLPWAYRVANRYLSIAGRSLVWQPVVRRALCADLVVVEQASKLLVNYVLVALHALGRSQVAFWGHGRNRQERPSRVGEAVKTRLSRQAHWWFAYTEGCVPDVVATGFPRSRITVVRNATDTRRVADARASMLDGDVDRLLQDNGVPSTAKLVVHLGGLYAAKRIDFLIAAVAELHQRDSDYHLLVVGDGPERPRVEAASREHGFVTHVGPRFGQEKAALLSAAELLLNPGLVGLSVLDAFAIGLPVVTVQASNHSPEIDYVVPGRTGLIVGHGCTPGEYATQVHRLINDEPARAAMSRACLELAQQTTIEEMARRFSEGIIRAFGGGCRVGLCARKAHDPCASAPS